MNQHQILTGACNAGDRCFAVGSVEGVNFTAYAAGCDIVILSSDFQRVQILPGAIHDNIQVSCIDCTVDSGKIAVSYANKVCIFEPTPLLQQLPHGLDYHWYHTGTIHAQSKVTALSCNHDGSRLLTGGHSIELWQAPDPPTGSTAKESSVEFFIDDGTTGASMVGQSDDDRLLEWRCVWQCRPATPVQLIQFSLDGLLFASVGKADRLVKIWYENKKVQVPLHRMDSVSPKRDELNYSFAYIAHPRAVTSFSWRKTSKYMPRGSVANMLISCCKDNICRLWVETVVPEDGLVDLSDVSPASTSAMYNTQRHRNRLMQRLQHIRETLMKRRRQMSSSAQPVMQIPSAQSQHDFHKFGIHPNSVEPGFHFHLAASINPETDIPLLPAMNASQGVQYDNFVVHWLNNKELHFTKQAEKLLSEMNKKCDIGGETSATDTDETEHTTADTTTEEDEITAEKPVHSKHRNVTRRPRHALLTKSTSIMSTDSEMSTTSSASTLTTSTVIAEPTNPKNPNDVVDHEIELLMRDWHSSSDMLFSIHPVDGSFLVWLVDWLDEYNPGSFRQAQVSFSSRIPLVIPHGDATTMSTHLQLYCNHQTLAMKQIIRDSTSFEDQSSLNDHKTKAHADMIDNTLLPHIYMLSKHTNGSLNQWQVTFAEKSKFSTVLSISHNSRACGHRFRTNSAASHAVLPLLLTTSHHNSPKSPPPKQNTVPDSTCHEGFCSELILWRVDPVGPLSQSGGITELSRINSSRFSAFSHVAWLPTLLPSSCLGSSHNSPSALFIASDGGCLRIYQAVIDARLLLTSTQQANVVEMSSHSNSSSSSGYMMTQTATTAEQMAYTSADICSVQSTSRPGCIIELDLLKNSKKDWQNIQLLHTFEERLMTGCKGGSYHQTAQDMMSGSVFEEQFYLVVLEKVPTGGSMLHMWKICIQLAEDTTHTNYTPDTNIYHDDTSVPANSYQRDDKKADKSSSIAQKRLCVTSEKLCSQRLALPDHVEVLDVSVAAGHLSSSSIYPACFAPYVISTACNDSHVRFWSCQSKKSESTEQREFIWKEWDMMMIEEDNSTIKIYGQPISVSCAYNGRVAIAYRQGRVRTFNDNPANKFVNLYVSIYECESTGGSQWTLEDTIELKHISLPECKTDIDMSVIYNTDTTERTTGSERTGYTANTEELLGATTSTPAIVCAVSVPSPSTIETVKRTLTNADNSTTILEQKHLVMLDWVSTEDGGHVLTVAVGAKVLLYAAVSAEVAQSTHKDNKSDSRTPRRGILQKSKSMTVSNVVEEIRWMKIRSIELCTADGLPPLPMHISWVRDGLLVVGMDNEMHVYTQWRNPDAVAPGSRDDDMRTLLDQSLHTVSSSASLNVGLNKNFLPSRSASSVKLNSSFSNIAALGNASAGSGLDLKDGLSSKRASRCGKTELLKSDSVSGIHLIEDCGLFEASRLANPVLPQYHPKQLIELLGFGKIRRVKAILAHLVRCISGMHSQVNLFDDSSSNSSHGRQTTYSHPRTLSVPSPHTAESSTIPEEIHLDYLEISSIPPLPLYALLAADQDTTLFKNIDATNSRGKSDNQDYTGLFHAEMALSDDELDDPFDDEGDVSTPHRRCRRHSSQTQVSDNYFGPAQSRILTRHLTHVHLPGLSSLDQMYLLALGDTVANTHLDFSDKQAADVAVSSTLARESGVSDNISSLDDCGLRYTLAARHHVYLMNTVTLKDRAKLQHSGLTPAISIWAFHSESLEELLQVMPKYKKQVPTWAEMRQFGCGWWIRNVQHLRNVVEKVAKAAFQAKKDPLDAALFYLAMKKKTLLWGLFRSVNDVKMTGFFRNNFSEDRWRRAALKNAFALLGRQRFEQAAAFFLLAGAVRDAIEVCLNKLCDLQLAMVIARLHESELDEVMPANLKRLLYEECLGCDQSGENQDVTSMHPDPFIRSMAFWLVKDYNQSLATLLDTSQDVARGMGTNDKTDVNSYTSQIDVFNFYNYLRTHPLIIRQQLATTAVDKCQTVLLSGFNNTNPDSENTQYIDHITPVERRLYFTTAHNHFKSGCPMLALEVLSKLPDVVDVDSDIKNSRSAESVASNKQSMISTGTFGNTAEEISSPAAPSTIDSSSAMDWSQPVSRFDDLELDLTMDDSESDTEETIPDTSNTESKAEQLPHTKAPNSSLIQGDIMAQQLKFIACLKIVMEELSTLATGFEVDGGQLRFQLYVWLEKEVEVLKLLCKYGCDITPLDNGDTKYTYATVPDVTQSHIPTLHEVLIADKNDFEAKLSRISRRKQWLQAHQQLLRTLLSYSVLHGACGGGLASIRMELILLLQELQQEKSTQQLQSPLPFPTTLPLLSACIASSKTVIADPIRHLQANIQDILHTVVQFTNPPVPDGMLYDVFVLRNLSAALSACIYQCLCDSDTFMITNEGSSTVGMEGFTSCSVTYKDSYLMAGISKPHKYNSIEALEKPTTLPAKWPGVSSLRGLLARKTDDDMPTLNLLLTEALVSVYMSLLIHALAMYDANILYRIAAHPFVDTMWATLFGGGIKKMLRISTDKPPRPPPPDDTLNKQRIKLTMKLLGPNPANSTSQQPTQKENKTGIREIKPTYKEKFIPPDVSIVSYLMTKPFTDASDIGLEYDSSESQSSSDDEDEFDEIQQQRTNDTAMTEHSDPNSYSWCLMRYALVKYIEDSLLDFLPKIGIELQDLPVCSPLLQSVLKTLSKWVELLHKKLLLFAAPPQDYIPGCTIDHTYTGPTLNKYKSLFEPDNTPFLCPHKSVLPVKRLWYYLATRESLKQIFILFIFKRSKPFSQMDTCRITVDAHIPEPIKVIHKDQDAVLSFCINQSNTNQIGVGTAKELIEMDINGIMSQPTWLQDQTEYDIETIKCPSPSRIEPEDFLLISTPDDAHSNILSAESSILPTANTATHLKGLHIPGVTNSTYSYYIVDRSRRLMRRILKRPLAHVRQMAGHPHLPYYLSGSQDGSVRLWEWAQPQCIAVARQPGSFPKVTHVSFNSQGNKFGVSDVEGALCLWQVGLGVNMNKPYLSLKCHNKTTSDFAFVGSSSFLATAGHSSDNRNVCLWDTLLPHRNALVHGFHCHNDGSQALVYAPKHQLIISAGRKGDVCLFDVRQRQIRHTFTAHESPIRSLALDPTEQFFVTGSDFGDIKVWGLSAHSLMYTYSGEHSKSSLFHKTSTGVSQLYVSQQNLYSCGADGSLKIRKLPNRDI